MWIAVFELTGLIQKQNYNFVKPSNDATFMVLVMLLTPILLIPEAILYIKDLKTVMNIELAITMLIIDGLCPITPIYLQRCIYSRIFKYIFKYINKGPDCKLMHVQPEDCYRMMVNGECVSKKPLKCIQAITQLSECFEVMNKKCEAVTTLIAGEFVLI
ncbi:hypothetical protein L218DRAFT_950423 [Marasmius fiardii PR-910]|nr:hypothetical protein L218DRAFT_950423 [Marasmius fiardii PR-910]